RPHPGAQLRITDADGMRITCFATNSPHPSAVSSAYLTSPTPFTQARARLYEKWQATDPLTSSYRAWFRRFDARLDARVERGLTVPPHVYEHAVRGLHPGFTAAREPDPALLDTLFPAVRCMDGPGRVPAGLRKTACATR
ncbi:hypothetical protein, partial [Streptomyces sp. NPDC056549]|uniref:hypothetical protein n=1 Tax=Streptomyces sp. NPDC056549 TaxID=3345864 RepID=UPI00367827C2